MANVTQIPAPRVELIDPRTGLMSREWFRFFNNLYVLTGGGTTDTSLADLQLAPVYQLTSPDATAADLAPQTVTVAEPQFDLSPRYELGTLASQNADNITFGNLTVSGTATFSAGTANQVQYLNASKVLTGSVNLTFDGTTLTAAGFAGPHNGTVGAGTPNTGAFTTLSASSTVSGTGFSTYLASPPAIGSTAANTGAFTTLSASSTFTLSGGTANGVGYLNGSKVFTTGAALTFDGTNFATTGTASATKLIPTGGTATGNGMYLPSANTLAWSTNGVETLRLTSAGRLGIGTTSPSDVLGISGGGIRIEGWNADATFIQQQFSAGYFQRVAGDSTNRQLRLESNSSDGGTSGSIAFRTSSSGTLSTTMTLDGAGNLTLNVGNLVQGTAAKGVNFTANTPLAGMTSQLLNWYEDGAYTPTVTAGTGSITSYSATAKYTRIGRQVTVCFEVTISNNGTGATSLIVTLPFTCGSQPSIGVGRENGSTGNILQAYVGASASTAIVLTATNGYPGAAGYKPTCTVTYFV